MNGESAAGVPLEAVTFFHMHISIQTEFDKMHLLPDLFQGITYVAYIY